MPQAVFHARRNALDSLLKMTEVFRGMHGIVESLEMSVALPLQIGMKYRLILHI